MNGDDGGRDEWLAARSVPFSPISIIGGTAVLQCTGGPRKGEDGKMKKVSSITLSS